MAVTLNDKYLKGVVNADELKGMEPMVKVAHEMIENKNGLGNDFLGWVDLPVNYDKEEFERIKKAAAKIKADSEVLIVIGIGGSYLGARAAIELLRSTLYNSLAKDTPKIFFAGNSISPTYLNEVIELVKDKDFSVNIISKSGTTTEPALAFRVFREMLEEKYGKDGAKGRIYATTDKAKGTLKELADAEGYETFVIPDDVGGRFSVLTAVGLLPIACAGCDIDALMAGGAPHQTNEGPAAASSSATVTASSPPMRKASTRSCATPTPSTYSSPCLRGTRSRHRRTSAPTRVPTRRPTPSPAAVRNPTGQTSRLASSPKATSGSCSSGWATRSPTTTTIYIGSARKRYPT